MAIISKKKLSVERLFLYDKTNMLTLPVFRYDAETSAILSSHAAALKLYESKVLLKIFGLVRVGND